MAKQDRINNSDLFIDTSSNKISVLNSKSSDFKITLVDTGYDTMTAGRIHKIKDYIDSEDFFLTYGDGLANINLSEELKFHKNAQIHLEYC